MSRYPFSKNVYRLFNSERKSREVYNNPFYADVAIDYESPDRLPEDGVPDDLPTVEGPESSEEQDDQQEDAEEQIPHQSHSFLPLPQQQQTE